MFGEKENLTDQLKGFAGEVASCVEWLEKMGYTRAEAIEITRIGVEDIKAETYHHKNKKLQQLADRIESLGVELNEAIQALKE